MLNFSLQSNKILSPLLFQKHLVNVSQIVLSKTVFQCLAARQRESEKCMVCLHSPFWGSPLPSVFVYDTDHKLKTLSPEVRRAACDLLVFQIRLLLTTIPKCVFINLFDSILSKIMF